MTYKTPPSPLHHSEIVCVLYVMPKKQTERFLLNQSATSAPANLLASSCGGDSSEFIPEGKKRSRVHLGVALRDGLTDGASSGRQIYANSVIIALPPTLLSSPRCPPHLLVSDTRREIFDKRNGKQKS